MKRGSLSWRLIIDTPLRVVARRRALDVAKCLPGAWLRVAPEPYTKFPECWEAWLESGFEARDVEEARTAVAELADGITPRWTEDFSDSRADWLSVDLVYNRDFSEHPCPIDGLRFVWVIGRWPEDA